MVLCHSSVPHRRGFNDRVLNANSMTCSATQIGGVHQGIAIAERAGNVTIHKTRKQPVLLALGVAAAAPAVLFVGAGTARADTASVQFHPVTLNNAPSLQVTIRDTGGNGDPGTYGARSYNATPVMGTMNFLPAWAVQWPRSTRDLS
jgi:hypothetical protein